jgi:hypothetical protein
MYTNILIHIHIHLHILIHTEDSNYSAGELGLQEAVKSLHLVRGALPEVLIVHLKRFSFDPQTFDMRKIGSPVDIPLNLDVQGLLADTHDTHDTPSASNEDASVSVSESGSGYTSGEDGSGSDSESGSESGESGSEHSGERGARGVRGVGVSQSSQSSQSSQYELSAVVVHEGSLDFGHYYTLVRSVTDRDSSTDSSGADRDSKDGAAEAGSSSSGAGVGGPASVSSVWHELNDGTVSAIPQEQVLEKARGDSRGRGGGSYSSNAYLAFYRRK